ncbi:DUF948 domain-containing protein [Pseudoramibacter sp.]|jgi:uncharacterized protein YoxC|uniref:DUF948 domain-containing protein n=1 Tax=Pseudoramibacter sp. TaxID=2034862 RepID=UPI0025DBB594|nr:DUF948 domain-containing protein [Pseudoramibacter sp.]MCH4072255.1 DUF948 domain-containing protein [Pseudoramibacter sp.]MCH4106025.1 DUF948 domain-containing protein [Pseudoramibacter sp.]
MNQMIPLSAVFWIIIAIAILFLVFHLVALLSETKKTMEKINALLDDNSEKITNIIDNADSMVTDAKTSVDTVKDEVIAPLGDVLGKVQRIFGKGQKRHKLLGRKKKQPKA